ncbi:lysine histidine transporter-like 5 [Malus sylvestris]|uniref:lysine histidine transporter-like 5 n=1 Tax=Malus sylvestris TaxID=3752 RepID=UPI0021AC4151|nr:lysine histidine transporter-like 5 [Malus sylvestris]
MLQVRNQWANQLLSLISSSQALPEPAIGISPTLTHLLLLSLPPDFDSLRENDIALQLPELRKLLQVLRENRHTEGKIISKPAACADMELPQPRPFGTEGRKSTHDFLSLYSHSTAQQYPRSLAQVALEVQATISSTLEKPSRIPMWKGALGAYFINVICYFPMALIGYWAFGQDVDDNVLMNLEKLS